MVIVNQSVLREDEVDNTNLEMLKMMRFVLSSIFKILITLLLTSSILFLLTHLIPGGPFAAAERNPNVSSQQLELLRERYGLHEPLYVQYAKWISGILRGDFGDSLKTHLPVIDVIKERIPNTILLMSLSLSLTFLVSLFLGIYSSVNQYSILDRLLTAASFIGQSIPVYWLGIILILVFYVWLKNPFTGEPLFPSSGMYSIDREHDLLNRLWHLVLPVSMLTISWSAWYSRYIRASMLEVINKDYIITARAKGLRERSVIFRHALRNAALPIVTLLALDFPSLFGGALFTEIVFAWPGMGRLFWDSTRSRDYPTLLAIMLINAVLISMSSFLADLVYRYLDPRIRFENLER